MLPTIIPCLLSFLSSLCANITTMSVQLPRDKQHYFRFAAGVTAGATVDYLGLGWRLPPATKRRRDVFTAAALGIDPATIAAAQAAWRLMDDAEDDALRFDVPLGMHYQAAAATVDAIQAHWARCAATATATAAAHLNAPPAISHK